MYCKCWYPEEANGQDCERCGGQKPTAQEVQEQNYNVTLLNSIDHKKDPDKFNRVMSRCEEFEGKYC